ncbi:MAG: sulfur oxidation c-type cytochrome SoxX [Gammaproteobacteria bacterium]|nr:sulfur oxidation c-type cytochrome SoxX [Gammaproteobacteria bacterium]MBU1655918.1 sulfur oxidation c-type cytochrome SoxX [Gammaproteobacteria bacterium]MBU1961790.1 sulfur oxidation c-type cytochrome SoxX [Gammaproteobacteria bacterium]
MKRQTLISLLLGATSALTCVSSAWSAEPDWRAEAIAMMERDFQAKGQATTDRLKEDDLQSICNKYKNAPPGDVADQAGKAQLQAMKYPADGQLMGDWESGEKIAQSGKGFTWTDEPGLPVGGNCYNCHQISHKEISYGTLGPSLLLFGAKRGGPTPENQKYVYGKIYNAKAFNLCSLMPRFGHVGALNEQQIKDLVALLLHPDSPVNK